MHKTKTDSVFTHIRDAIVAGELSQGDWIRPQDWFERLKVSAIPVREALRRLEAQGLVEIDPHRGARVTTQTESHIAETYLIRMALEALAAGEAVRRLSDDAFSDLYRKVESLTEAMIEAVNAKDGAATRSLNEEIHMSIYQASGLPRLVALIESLWATYPFRTLTWRPNRPAQIISEHRKLLRTLKERNPEKFAAATAQHIRASQETLALDNAKTNGSANGHVSTSYLPIAVRRKPKSAASA